MQMKELDWIFCHTRCCLICSSRPFETTGGGGGGVGWLLKVTNHNKDAQATNQ